MRKKGNKDFNFVEEKLFSIFSKSNIFQVLMKTKNKKHFSNDFKTQNQHNQNNFIITINNNKLVVNMLKALISSLQSKVPFS